MTNSSRLDELFNLPVGPAELCFDKTEFTGKYFSADEFLHKHRNSVTLESMRDDLGIYLKVLRTSMIELINEHYADFVDLSSNLNGLDQSMRGLQVPLQKLQNDCDMLRNDLQTTITDISAGLENKKRIQQCRHSLHALAAVLRNSLKLRSLLETQLNTSINIRANILERAALELIQLNYNRKYCQHLLTQQQKDDAQMLHNALLAKVQQNFMEQLKSDASVDSLERALRVFCTLDECTAAEVHFRRDVVSVYMKKFINEQALQNCPKGLTGIYEKILEFFPSKMKALLQLTQGATARVKGFNFVLNSVWTEVETCLEMNMASIFAPGNPETFYQKYRATVEFLERIEAHLHSKEDINRFRAHSQYKSFQTRWNLPVYFQIRFQEIGSTMEWSCSRTVNVYSLKAPTPNTFAVLPISTAVLCIKACWSDGVYISQIFSRFWLLTLQLLARANKWINESITSANWQKSVQHFDKIEFLVALIMDGALLNQRLDEILAIGKEKAPDFIRNQATGLSLLDQSISETRKCFAETMATVTQHLVDQLVAHSVVQMKQAIDIPRLYRKTNREIPSKACPYVDTLLQPSLKFHQLYGNLINCMPILESVFSIVSTRYHKSVSEVITSVQKTEESLRRLKNLRERTSGQIASSPSANSITSHAMSDDDKIRHQLLMDVQHWTQQIQQLGCTKEDIDKLGDLRELVEDAIKAKTG